MPRIGFNDQPAVWVEVVKQILVVGVLFGLKLTQEQMAGLFVLVGMLGTLVVHQNVVPTSQVATRVDGKTP